ncbi:Glycolipid transfer protein (GLTP) [Musa troglodytarum]|uniref:Glycolipid transfer protein (GLTP) n=1 Tax=Musa troglodytarum TaxID=320322 RepID=A0A9E7HUQ2_9LILI|nr:Glycolipid transfer protein (GLTP) [Musa troglodytarum]
MKWRIAFSVDTIRTRFFLHKTQPSSDVPCSAVGNRSTNLLGLEFDRMILIFGSDRLPLSLVNDPTRSKDQRVEMAGTVFTPSLEGMKHVKSENGVILTKPFLDVCKLILPVLDKFGAAMSIVKSDIGGNITRLETKYNSDPSKFEHLYSMVQVEVQAKTAKGSSSCTNGLLWLTSMRLSSRAMDYLVELFRNLLEHQDWIMSQVAMKLAPDRKKFMEVISGSGDINADMEKFCTTFAPLLAENHKFLVQGKNKVR